MNTKKKEEVLSTSNVPSQQELITKYGNKSKAIRALSAEGKSRGEIAKLLNIRYQHVRNVLITPIKKVS